MPSTLVGDTLPWTFSSTTATGAMAQQPMQATLSRLNWRSGVIYPTSMASFLSQASRMILPPFIWQAVPRQTFIGCFPGGMRRN